MRRAVPFAWRSSRVRAGRFTLAVHEAGAVDAQAPALLLLHGLGHWSDGAWGALVPYLGASHRCIAFDLPGFGASEKPRARYDAAFFRTVTRDLADALGLERFALAGHSLGGFIAADLAGEAPQRVTHLALIAPAGFTRTPRHIAFSLLSRALGRPFTARAPSPRVVRRILERAVFDPDVLDAADVARAEALAQDAAMRRAFIGVYAAATELFVRSARHARFARFAGPVFCAWGAHDRYIPVAALADVRRVYPRASTLVLERSAHLPMIEEPGILGPALAAFLRS